MVTKIKRTLSGKGHLQSSVGQEVTPAEIIGRAEVPSGFRTINLSSMLSVSPKGVEKYLKRKIGQRIYKGELLAYKQEWLLGRKKVITAPTDGVLDFFNNQTGELRISLFPKKTDLPAGVYGIVEAVDHEKGQVIIRTEVSQVHGVFGSGRSRDGWLHILGTKDNMISKAMLEASYNAQVLVGGSLIFRDAVSAAISVGISGIITGGMNAEDYRGMAGGRIIFPKKLDSDIGISIVVCEGFGSIPIGSDIFEILSEYEGKFVFIDGNRALINLPSANSSSLVKVKNTRLPELGIDDSMASLDRTKTVSELKIGAKVRIVGNAYCGEQGKVLAIDNSETLLPSKIKVYLATVETKRRKLQVPVANLEIIM